MSQSKLKLLDLINNTNYPAIPLSLANVDLLDVAPATEGGAAWNSRVTVTALPDKGYQGSRTMFYRRLALSVIGEGLVLQAEGMATAQDLLDELNTTYGAWIDLIDLEAFTFPLVEPGASVPLTLTAKADSFGWTGSISLTLQGPYPGPTVDISDGSLVEV